MSLDAGVSARVDRWLWAVRLFPTRTSATEACRAGHVRVNRQSVKPATPVHVGDEVVVRGAKRERVVEVAKIIERRVGAPIAATCMVDHSPPPPPREDRITPFARDPGSGRPTKRERREIDRLRRF